MSNTIDHAIHAMVSKTKVLTLEEEQRLVTKWIDEGDISARDQLLEAHLKLVASMANRFSNSGAQFSDLFSEGVEAMIKAADGFDRQKKCRFSTYASWWIFSKLQDAVHRDIYSVKIGRSHDEKKVLRILQVAKRMLGSPLNQTIIERIAFHAKVDVELVNRINGATTSRSNSLNATLGQKDQPTGTEYGDVIEDLSATEYGAEFVLVTNNQRNLLEKYFLRLTDKRAAQIIRQRWLASPGDQKSFSDFSETFNVSKERIRQIERDALAQIRTMMKEDKIVINDLLAS